MKQKVHVTCNFNCRCPSISQTDGHRQSWRHVHYECGILLHVSQKRCKSYIVTTDRRK